MIGKKKRISEREVDRIVIGEADRDAAWDKPIRVSRSKSAAIPLPSELAARAAFFARLHHEASLEQWIERIVNERINLEEAAFAELKRELAVK